MRLSKETAGSQMNRKYIFYLVSSLYIVFVKRFFFTASMAIITPALGAGFMAITAMLMRPEEDGFPTSLFRFGFALILYSLWFYLHAFLIWLWRIKTKERTNLILDFAICILGFFIFYSNGLKFLAGFVLFLEIGAILGLNVVSSLASPQPKLDASKLQESPFDIYIKPILEGPLK